MDQLQQARAEIDRIDGELARLFEARMAAAAEIAAYKQARGLPVRDPVREAALLARNTARIGDTALRPHFAAFMEAMMAQSRAYQEEIMAGSAEEGKTSPARRGGGPASSPEERCLPYAASGSAVPSCAPDKVSTLNCPIYLDSGVLQRAAALLDLERRVFVVTDDGVPAQYAGSLAAQCREATVYTVPQGEASKSPEALTALLEAMLRAGLTRSDCLAVVGGGVVCDLAGLAAGLYMRGIDCYYFATTLLAMVDAAVGGKTAVDLTGVKNAVGLFRQPKAVIIDPDTLATLPPRQLANGLAEAVKMALTHDPALFARFEDPAGYGAIEDVIAACLRIKTAVVAADEREAGLRRVLNFGHTLGHGIEAAAQGRLLHGEAVALGMLPLCAPAVRARLVPVLDRLGLPTYVNQSELDPELVLTAILHDKKRIDDEIECVYVPEPGCFEFQRIRPAELRSRLNELYRP